MSSLNSLKVRVNSCIKSIIKNHLIESEVIELLQSVFDETIDNLEREFNRKSKIPRRKINIIELEKSYCLTFGINRTTTNLNLGRFLFKYIQKVQCNILAFILIKESIAHFIDRTLTEIDEVILNITATLFLKELFNLTSLDNPLIASTSRFYPQKIVSYSNIFHHNLLFLLFSRKINSSEVLEQFLSYIDNQIDPQKIPERFKNWVIEKALTQEDNLIPIYLKSKQIRIIEHLLQNGEEQSSSNDIAKVLNLSSNSIRTYFMNFNETYSTSWRAEINFEKLGLYNYFFRISINRKDIYEKLLAKLSEEKYLRGIYFSQSDNNEYILYSPGLICPFLIGENLGMLLEKYLQENLIDDYIIQLVRERMIYTTITSYPYHSSLDTFEQFMKGGEKCLYKHVFSKEEKKYSHENLYEISHLDYNLLFFLSIIRGKSLQKARYYMNVPYLPKLYEKNDIKISDVESQTYFLNQLELRAKRRSLIKYKLYMRNISIPNRDICVIEIPKNDNEKNYDRLIDKLRCFSYLTQTNLLDRIIITIPSISHTHPIIELIKKETNKENLNACYYTINILKTNFVPYHDLYDYVNRKWKL